MVIKIYLDRNGRNDGPYSEESIREHLESGKVEKDDWAWAKGQEQWVRLFDLVDIGEGQEQTPINPKELTKEQVLEYSEKIKKLIASDQEIWPLTFFDPSPALGSTKNCSRNARLLKAGSLNCQIGQKTMRAMNGSHSFWN